MVELVQLLRNAYVLWTVGHTLSATDAMVGLTIAWYRTVKADEVLAAMLPVFRVANFMRQHSLVLTLVVVDENTGNIHAVGAWHAVFTVVARNILQSEYLVGNVFVQILHFLF